MILKRLYEEYDVSIERILIKEYKRLKLSMQDAHVLLALFSIYKKRRTFTLAALSKRIDYTADQIGASVETLIDRGFLIISLENKEGKEREVFDLDQTFKKIEDLFAQDDIDKVKQQTESEVALTLRLFEQGMGRQLLPYELETVRRWYEDHQFSHDKIIKAITTAQDRVSVKYVEKVLNQNIPEPIEIDEEVENVLDEIFKKIK
jgi:DNA replication protein